MGAADFEVAAFQMREGGSSTELGGILDSSQKNATVLSFFFLKEFKYGKHKDNIFLG